MRLLKGDEMVSEEFFAAPNFNNARLTAKTRILTLRAAFKYEITYELAFVGNED